MRRLVRLALVVVLLFGLLFVASRFFRITGIADWVDTAIEDVGELVGKVNIFKKNVLVYESLGNGTCSVSIDKKHGTSGTIEIPAYSPDGERVVQIGNFSDRKRLKGVIIPDGVEMIQRNGFAGCKSLEKVNIPDSVTRIDQNAFKGCDALLQEENHVYYVDQWAVDFDRSADSIAFRDGTIGFSGGFAKTLDTEDESYGAVAELRHLYLSSSMIYFNFLVKIPYLQTITVEKGNPVFHSEGNCLINTEQKALVLGCAGSVIPNDGSVERIQVNSFVNLSNCAMIAIPAAVNYIGGFAFQGCSNMSIQISKDVERISGGAFFACTSLTIYTDAETKPEGWYDLEKDHTVVWNYQGH